MDGLIYEDIDMFLDLDSEPPDPQFSVTSRNFESPPRTPPPKIRFTNNIFKAPLRLFIKVIISLFRLFWASRELTLCARRSNQFQRKKTYKLSLNWSASVSVRE